MPRSCCVPGCKSNYYKGDLVSTFSFPNDKAEREKWVKCINRDNFVPTKNNVVCINHFASDFVIKEYNFQCEDGSFISWPRKRLKLQQGAFPTIFENQRSCLSKQLPLKRKDPSERLKKCFARENQFEEWNEKDNINSSEEFQNEMLTRCVKPFVSGKQTRRKKILAPEPSKNVRRKKRKVAAESSMGIEVPTNRQEEEQEVSYSNDTEEMPVEFDSEGEDRMSEPENGWDMLCRLCASRSEVFVSVFEDRDCLLDKIHTYLPILITPEDPLPKTVCKECVNRLEICHKLIHGCLEAEAALKRMLCHEKNNEVHSKSSKSLRSKSETMEKQYESYFEDNDEGSEGSAHFVETGWEYYKEGIQEEDTNYISSEETTQVDNIGSPENDSYSDQVAEIGVVSEESAEVEYHGADYQIISEDINVEEMLTKDGEEIARGSLVQMEKFESNASNDLEEQKQTTSKITEIVERCKLIGKEMSEKKKGTPSSKFKVIIVKVKNGKDVMQSEEFKKNLESAINSTPKTKKPQKGASKKEVEVKENVTLDHMYTLESSQHSCTLCSLIFQNRESLVLHQAAVHKIFYCQLCHTFYDSSLDLEEHSRTLHGQPIQSEENENIDQSSGNSVPDEHPHEGTQG